MSGGPDPSLRPDSVVITIAEAAQLLGVSPSTARRLASRGDLPGLIGKLGPSGAWRVNREALLNYMNAPLRDNGSRRA